LTFLTPYFKVISSKVSAQNRQVLQIFQKAVAEKRSAASAIRELKEKGLTYRRTHMLEDFRRMQHIAKVKPGNIEGQQRALDFFDKVVEPYRKQHKLTYDKAILEVRKYLEGQVETIQKARQIEGYLDDYGFGETP